MDCHEITSSYETLKLSSRKEHLYLLNQHFALRHLGLRKSPGIRGGTFPHHLLMARELGSKTRSQDEWEDQAAILDLPGAMAYMKDQHFPFLNHQEKLQYLQAHQELKARMELSFSPSQDKSRSPMRTEDKECKKEGLRWEDPDEEMREKWILINGGDLEPTEKAETVKDYLIEAPLDLSAYGKGRENLKLAKCQKRPMKHEVESPSEELQESPLLQKTSDSSQFPVASLLHGSQGSEKLMVKAQEDIAGIPISSLQEHPISKAASCDTAPDGEANMHFGTEEQETSQPDDVDSESMKEESDEPNTTDSEVAGPGDGDSFQDASMKEKYCHMKKNDQASPKKRKRGQDSLRKGTNKRAFF